jgi:hypothetical protein
MFTFMLVVGSAVIALAAAKLLFDGGSDSVKAWQQTPFWKVLSWFSGKAKPGGLVHAFSTTIMFVIDLALTGLIVFLCAKFFGIMVGTVIGGVMALVVSIKFRKARRSLGKEKEE